MEVPLQTHIGKAIRISDLLQKKSLLFDSTIASSTGATPPLADLKKVLRSCSGLFDGIVVNPGQMEHLCGR